MKVYSRRAPRDNNRPQPPKRWRFTDRDKAIVQAIYDFEGFLSVDQVWRLFFPPTTAGLRKAHERLSYMWRAHILNRPTSQERGMLPELIYWLDEGGAEFVAAQAGVPLTNRFQWIKKPRFFSVPHDLSVNDFHILILAACQQYRLKLVEWVSSWQFANDPDVIEFTNYQGKRNTKKMLPDSYFSIIYDRHELRYMVEIDTASETNYSVIYEKVVPTYPYLQSTEYKQRFGRNSGRRIIITDGDRRARKLLERTNTILEKNTAQFVLITTFDRVSADSVLTEPIWYKGGSEGKHSLIEG